MNPNHRSAFVNLVWRNLPRPNVENLTAASASAKLFADKLRENLKETEFELESVTQSTKDQTMASTRIYFKNITDPKQYAEIIALMQKTASAEKARTTPIANNSAVPTPDDVEVKGDDAVMGLIESDNEMVNGQNGMTNGTGLVPPA
ncbi:MAG: hypothetical protein L6R41_001461 [Letrouitia leprolyta]|nr:MAG: hypothetical protein L6R41_001461 [Letrouitia leprolyta]